MRILVLVDNNTRIDQYYLGEPAACFYIEDGGTKILLDSGYSDVFIKNAGKMHVDLKKISHIALSHGHNDHTRGLRFLHGAVDMRNITIVAHPGIFAERYEGAIPIGCPVERSFLEDVSRLVLTKEPHSISEHITFLGEIPAVTDFERTKPVGFVKDAGGTRDDFVADDSALALTTENGLFIVTGCSHSGICNIIEHARKVCNEERIAGVLGGFHLLEVSQQLVKTIEYFKRNNITNLYPCHCVSFAAKAEIHRQLPIHEVGVGMEIVL